MRPTRKLVLTAHQKLRLSDHCQLSTAAPMISGSQSKMKFGWAVAAALVFWVSSVSAQDNGLAGRVRALNAQLLQLHGLVQSAGAGGAAALRSQAAPIIEQRTQALSDLIKQDPKEALSLAFSEDLLAALRNSFPQSAGRLESNGAWEGVIDYLVTMDFDLVTPGRKQASSDRRVRTSSVWRWGYREVPPKFFPLSTERQRCHSHRPHGQPRATMRPIELAPRIGHTEG